MAKDSILDVIDMLNEYSRDIQDAIKEDAVKVAKKGQQTLKQTSPKRTGKYARGWRVQHNMVKNGTNEIVYNTNAGLTHLLERTHNKRGGGTVTPKSAGHIYNVEQACIKEYENDITKIITGGSR